MLRNKGLRLSEEMSGWIIFFHDRQRRQHPFSIQINAFTKKILQLSAKRSFQGTATFPGFHRTVPIEGTMQISLKGVVYDMELHLDDMGKVRIKGEKKYSLKQLKFSLITLSLEVFKKGGVIGQAELVYRDPLWKFPLGLSLVEKEYAYSSEKEFADKLVELVPLFIPDYNKILSRQKIKDNLYFELKQRDPKARKYAGVLYQLLKTYIAGKFQKKINKLNTEEKEQLSRELGPLTVRHFIFFPLVEILLSSVYGSKEFFQKTQVEMKELPQVDEQNRWDELCHVPNIQLSKNALEVDVVVVGSGAGGGAMAYALAKQGHAVAIVEEGSFYKRKEFSGRRSEMLGKLYRNKGLQFPLSNSAIWLPTGKCVGGTTTINCGTCMRPTDQHYKRWKKELGLNINLDSYIPEVERILNVTEVPTQYQGSVASIMQEGIKGTDLIFEPLKRAEMGCDGQTSCAFGCPTGAKRSVNESFVPEALKKNAYLFSNYKLEKILFDKNKATGIVASLPGFGPEFQLTIRAQKVVLATGSLVTPQILQRAGLGDELSELGKNLTIHPALVVGALYPHKVRDKMYAPQSCYVHDKQNERFVLEGYTLPIDTVPLTLGLLGKDLSELMNKINNFTNFASMHSDPIKGKIRFLPYGRSIPEYFLTQKSLEDLKDAALSMGEIFFKTGALKVYTPIKNFETIRSLKELEKLKETTIKPWQIKISAHHPLGTCRMGSSPQNSVVSPEGKVWGRENLYVCDGSTIPGPLGINPQVTIISNSMRIGNHVGATLV